VRIRIAVEPADAPGWARDAVIDGGADLVAPPDAEAVVWGGVDGPEGLDQLLRSHRGIGWVHFLWAGIDRYVPTLPRNMLCTCGKGANAEPVAEFALLLALAGLRRLHHWTRAEAWSPAAGVQLYDQPVTIVGGGNIGRALIDHLVPFRCEVTVIRRRADPVPGAIRVVTVDALHDTLPGAAVVFLALPLTSLTCGLVGSAEFDRMNEDAWLVNVSRGRLVVTDDLVVALREGRIGGAALDVTDPEPLPEEHPLWSLRNCIITPHTANFPEISRESVASRVRDNVARYLGGQPLNGLVDLNAGY
jgi:phosphoglycerate dehydrogenase-like enzyme